MKPEYQATLINLEGKRFGSWTVLKVNGHTKSRKVKWLCVCDCGTEKNIRGRDLKSGEANRCHKCYSRTLVTHGDSNTPFHKCWQAIKQRCLNPKCSAYKDYGARGITVCDEWENDYLAFKRDMVEGWAPGLTIERIDNNKGYYKENCRWIVMKLQARNRRSTRYLTTSYGTLSTPETAELAGLSYSCVYNRYKKGLIGDELIQPPMHK